ncbi:31861_t:CDS:1 [Racocetra persica]|uniref:31861_t:CDS:1 n=1 Tax=Racocetra persica TaxID=160502 RepID=A0ACA9NAD6_9GLOM|nr:31861_t:CDS:1 [Racocetra persica]
MVPQTISQSLWLPTNKNIQAREDNLVNSWFTTTKYISNQGSNKKYFVFEPDDEDYTLPRETELKTLKIRIYSTLSEAAILCRWMDGVRWTYNKITQLHFYDKLNYKQVKANCLNDDYIERNPDGMHLEKLGHMQFDSTSLHTEHNINFSNKPVKCSK